MAITSMDATGTGPIVPAHRAAKKKGSSSSLSSKAATGSSSSSKGRPGRALRWIRFGYYCIFAPVFLYSFYVQLVVLKGPGRTPLPASTGFGRDSVFLTFHGNFHCTWYSCLCLLHCLLDFGKRRDRKSRDRKLLARMTHRYTPILFPLAAFVGVAYYLILHFHPMTRLRARSIPDYDEKMALLHAVPLLFVIGDALLKDEELTKKYALDKRSAVKGICTYGIVYFCWSCICVYLNGGHWPYPFQKHFSPIHHLSFLSTVLLVAVYLARLGFRITARLDKRRRRRLARTAIMADMKKER